MDGMIGQPQSPFATPGVKLMFESCIPAYEAFVGPDGGLLFRVGFVDQRSGICAFGAFDRIGMADHIKNLTQLRDAAVARISEGGAG